MGSPVIIETIKTNVLFPAGVFPRLSHYTSFHTSKSKMASIRTKRKKLGKTRKTFAPFTIDIHLIAEMSKKKNFSALGNKLKYKRKRSA